MCAEGKLSISFSLFACCSLTLTLTLCPLLIKQACNCFRLQQLSKAVNRRTVWRSLIYRVTIKSKPTSQYITTFRDCKNVALHLLNLEVSLAFWTSILAFSSLVPSRCLGLPFPWWYWLGVGGGGFPVQPVLPTPWHESNGMKERSCSIQAALPHELGRAGLCVVPAWIQQPSLPQTDAFECWKWQQQG